MIELNLIPAFDYRQAIIDLQGNTPLTQTDIATAIGVTQGRISQIANDIDSETLKYESRARLYALCQTHNIIVEFFA